MPSPIDELQGFLQNNPAAALSPQNPLSQNADPSANPSNPTMNPANPTAWANPSNPELNPNLPGAQTNPSNPKYNPSMPGAQNNPSNYAMNPTMPGSMTNPSNPSLNPAYPGSLTNPANPIHNPDFPVHEEIERPPGLSENASLPPAHASWRLAWDDDEVTEIAGQAAGAASVPWMKNHPDETMPSEETLEGVNAVLDEFGVKHTLWRLAEWQEDYQCPSCHLPLVYQRLKGYSVRDGDTWRPIGFQCPNCGFDLKSVAPQPLQPVVAKWHLADNYTQDTREWPDPTEPRASEPPSPLDCTCRNGTDSAAKLMCPIHGLQGQDEKAHDWSMPEGWPVGYPQDAPRNWTQAVQSKVADYYHLAPTEERQHIRTWGLQPSAPAVSGKWGQGKGMRAQPTGVYLQDNPEVGEWTGYWSPTSPSNYDIWRVPGTLEDVKPDPLVTGRGALVSPHAITPQEHGLELYRGGPESGSDWPGEELPHISAIPKQPWHIPKPQRYPKFFTTLNQHQRGKAKALKQPRIKRSVMDPQHLQEWMSAGGDPYLYHATSPEAAEAIKREGLYPHDYGNLGTGDLHCPGCGETWRREEAPLSHYDETGEPIYECPNPDCGLPMQEDPSSRSKWAGQYYRPRSNHVYLGTSDLVSKIYSRGNNRWLRVDLRKLNPAQINPDEDAFNPGAYTPAHYPIVGQVTNDNYPPSADSFYEHGMSFGDWADQANLGQDPEETKHSLFAHGAIAHNGPISPEAIEEVDPRTYKPVEQRQLQLA